MGTTLQTLQRNAHTPLSTPGNVTVTDMTICTSSSIRTMTVGSGIAPDLLTPLESPDCR
jgi:hypothetical protein